LAKHLQTEIIFPSDIQTIEELLVTIPEFASSLGSMDCTTQQIHMPNTVEYRFYRDDKGIHFMNTLAAVDWLGFFTHVEPGFSGRFADRGCYQYSHLHEKNEES